MPPAGWMVIVLLLEQTELPYEAHTRIITVRARVSFTATIMEFALSSVGGDWATNQLAPPSMENWCQLEVVKFVPDSVTA
jgi:hypothetical protein